VSSILDVAFLQQAFYYFCMARSAVMSESQMDKVTAGAGASTTATWAQPFCPPCCGVKRPQHAFLEPHISLAARDIRDPGQSFGWGGRANAIVSLSYPATSVTAGFNAAF
jgi:hypothetical protein